MSFPRATTSTLAPIGQAWNRRILVIDQDPAVHRDFQSIFGGKSNGFEVDDAFQGEEGLKMVEHASAEGRPYALAFMDLPMPLDAGGIETTRRIWQLCPDLQIVICTASIDHSWREVHEDAHSLDQLLILKKPFDSIEVLQMAEALTEKWRLHQESNIKREDLERMVKERTKDLEDSQAAALKMMEDAVRNSEKLEQAYQELKREEADRRQLEEQFREQASQLLRSQRMESVGRLASGIAHDMNNILAPILLSVFMLRRPLPPEEFEKTLANVEISTKRGADLVKQLLMFGRGAGGRREVVRTTGLIHDMEKLIHGTFPKDIIFSMGLSEEPWPVMGDGTQLHQVLLNLCVNARDAMPRGGKLSLTTKNVRFDENYAGMHAEAKPGPYLCLSVSDTGEGIPPEVMDKIFDPFFTTKEMGNGTGLGLSTVMGIVKGHNGFVNLRSKVGSGSTFEIYVPAVPDAVESANAAPVAAPLRGHGEMILVVDDEEGIRDVLKKTLLMHGYKVISAGDGIEAIVQYTQHRNEIKAVLTDIMMPVMDGVTMTRALKRMDPDVKIIASSGIGAVKDKEDKTAEMNSLGVTTFLSKPYTASEILAAIGKLLVEVPLVAAA